MINWEYAYDPDWEWSPLSDISKESLQNKMDTLEGQGWKAWKPVAWSAFTMIDGERKFGWSVTMFKEKT